MTATSPYSITDFDPLDPQTLQCPHGWHRALRAQAPVHFVASRGMWFVTSRELVTRALADHTVFSSAFGLPQLPIPDSIAAQVAEIQARGWPPVPTLLTADPPEHHYYRRMLAKAFTPRFIARLEPEIRAIARSLVGNLPEGESVDLVGTFAAPLPLRVIAQVLGVSDERIDDFKRWSDQFTATVGGQLDDAGLLDQARGMLEYQQYFAAELDERRARPREDLLSGLVATPSAESGDEPLGTGAILSIIQQLLIAGNETSTKLITGVLHELVRAPQWWERLRDNPIECSEAVIEEGLRLLSPVQSMFRITTTETSLGGYTIPAGALVVLVFGSANRDETAFDRPDDFDPGRANVKAHLAFGAGIHACLGAPLARLESRIALQELARRFTSIRAADDNDFAYEPSFMLRGLRRLALILETGDPR
ncbi:cytochrome P450 [Nocardia sp. CDC159]|uniref:Cytochrome P450 n=1 Tax=Nocardia pulmonis TaxID=2951408 RepID=A0A9X2E2A0_9NOCA|nr:MULTISPECIES: cytochrome P450 [Nocardia]MCM6772564.1 cytochrome P450 [Nocardia pulmonis]MCM6784778.1 cytochrome P450 [Nocardia sp. CDC159]